jgi:hypothetical protein
MPRKRQPRDLPDPINVRLPEELLTKVRQQALKNERTISGEVRWLLQRAVQEEEKERRIA